jgi:hypothetical protein
MMAKNEPDTIDGLDTRTGLARKWHVTDRTIIRYEKLGLPVIKRGRFRLYDPPVSSAWLRGELPRTEVRRGRPRTR